MKTTLDLPEQLMDQVKVLAEREQRNVDDVVAGLIQAGLESQSTPELAHKDGNVRAASLRYWFSVADQQNSLTPDGPSARQLHQQDRHRLE